jgi:hypothetical protein
MGRQISGFGVAKARICFDMPAKTSGTNRAASEKTKKGNLNELESYGRIRSPAEGKL